MTFAKLLYIIIPPLSVLFLAVRTYLISVNAIRRPKDVLRDLAAECADDANGQTFHSESNISVRIAGRYLPLLVGALASSLHAALSTHASFTSLVVGGVALSFVYLVQKRMEEFKADKERQDLEFYLPVVMERIVMAVQAGLDIIPALEAVYTLGRKEADASGEDVDPVTLLVGRVIELNRSGQGLEEALAQTGKDSQATGVRHAFIHLSLAHREGGELMTPLRELSDATQLYYQETVEEVIAKLPVKATLPLLCTFAGLIICFLTVPIIEVMSMTQQSIPSGPIF